MGRFLSTVRLSAVAGAALVALALAAGGSSSSGTASKTSTAGGKTYVIGTSGDFPPFGSPSASNPNDIVGFEPDMMKAVMGHLGLKYKWVIGDFNGLIPGIQSGRFDMIVSDVYDTALRRKVVSFVDYLQSGLSIMVKSRDAAKVKSFSDLCGKPVGVLTGSPSEVTPLQDASKKCEAAGNSSIQMKSFPAVAQEVPALENGTLYAIFEDSVTLGLIESARHGKVKVVFDDPAARTNIGIIVKKGSPLKAQLTAAIKWYLGSAAYRQNAAKWKLPTYSLLKK